MRAFRFFLGFAIAPVSFGLLLFVISLLTGKPAEGVLVVLFVAFVGYPVALLFGLPLLLLFERFQWNGLLAYGSSAIAFSFLLIFLFVVAPMLSEGLPLVRLFTATRLTQMCIIAMGCILTVLTFWLIARPDRN